jgi:hypothetical protein
LFQETFAILGRYFYRNYQFAVRAFTDGRVSGCFHILCGGKVFAQFTTFLHQGEITPVQSQLPWDKPLLERWETIKNDLFDLEIFGENLYGVHSIGYKKLESFFYVFAIRSGEEWLSWEEVKFYAALLDFPTVPEIPIKVKLKDFYNPSVDENKLLDCWLVENLGMTWKQSTSTPGLLGGYDVETGEDASEGFVVRNIGSFISNDGKIPVAENEFNNLFKIVRASHVKTNEHWTKNWQPASLLDYEKFKWYNYNFKKKS